MVILSDTSCPHPRVTHTEVVPSLHGAEESPPLRGQRSGLYRKRNSRARAGGRGASAGKSLTHFGVNRRADSKLFLTLLSCSFVCLFTYFYYGDTEDRGYGPRRWREVCSPVKEDLRR